MTGRGETEEVTEYNYHFDPLLVTETNQTLVMEESSSPCYLKFEVDPSLKRWNMTYSRQIKLEIKMESVSTQSCGLFDGRSL